MNRDFTYKGIKFHLNDNGNKGDPWREFEGKYQLLWWNEFRERWQQITTIDTKQEAIQYAKENYQYLYG